MPKYAQIDETGKLMGLSQLSGEVENPFLIQITDEEFASLRVNRNPAEGELYHPKWDGKGWVEGLTAEEIEAIKNPVIPPDPIKQIQEENAMLFMELANKDLQIQSLNNDVAALTMQLVMKGVI